MENFPKIVELATAYEIAYSMDLNVAAELLDNIDEQMKERAMTKIQKTKKVYNIPKKLLITTPFIFASALALFLLPDKTEPIIENESRAEWVITEQISEYELGMNTVEYFEDMMPRVYDEEIQSGRVKWWPS